MIPIFYGRMEKKNREVNAFNERAAHSEDDHTPALFVQGVGGGGRQQSLS